MSQFKHPYCCWISGNKVDLETCNIDEHGMAVHGDCYFAKVALATESMRPTVRKPISALDLVFYDVSADGQKFLIDTKVVEPNTALLSITLNWASELEK